MPIIAKTGIKTFPNLAVKLNNVNIWYKSFTICSLFEFSSSMFKSTSLTDMLMMGEKDHFICGGYTTMQNTMVDLDKNKIYCYYAITIAKKLGKYHSTHDIHSIKKETVIKFKYNSNRNKTVFNPIRHYNMTCLKGNYKIIDVVNVDERQEYDIYDNDVVRKMVNIETLRNLNSEKILKTLKCTKGKSSNSLGFNPMYAHLHQTYLDVIFGGVAASECSNRNKVHMLYPNEMITYTSSKNNPIDMDYGLKTMSRYICFDD